jgi:hypothetical protein
MFFIKNANHAYLTAMGRWGTKAEAKPFKPSEMAATALPPGGVWVDPAQPRKLSQTARARTQRSRLSSAYPRMYWALYNGEEFFGYFHGTTKKSLTEAFADATSFYGFDTPYRETIAELFDHILFNGTQGLVKVVNGITIKGMGRQEYEACVGRNVGNIRGD